MSDAADRLARTRLAIIEHVHRREQRHDKRARATASESSRDEEPWEAAQEAAAHGATRFDRLKRAARSYWHIHPARMGLQIATPLLARYGSQHPLAYLSIAAATGALIMVARPWRLVSVTGVLLALARSPQLAGVVMSAMSGVDEDFEEPY